MTTNEQDRAMRETTPAELGGIAGGGIVIVGDGYCGTPWPGPRPLGINQVAVNPQPLPPGDSLPLQWGVGRG
jgi:hypothetical protein